MSDRSTRCAGCRTTRPVGTTRSTTELHESADFIELRRRYRGFVFPATVAFLSWYLLYVVMSQLGRTTS